MGERINIQYSVDVGDLPREVGRLLERAFNEYQMLQSSCRTDIQKSVMSHEMVEHIDEIRLILAAIDHGLSDASNIIVGYLNYKSQSSAQTIDEVPEELHQKLGQFKKLLAETAEDEISD